MSRMTFYVEYEEGKEPTNIGANTQILGGRLRAFSWDDDREIVKNDLRMLIMSNAGLAELTSKSVWENVDDNALSVRDLIMDICDAFDLWEDEE